MKMHEDMKAAALNATRHQFGLTLNFTVLQTFAVLPTQPRRIV